MSATAGAEPPRLVLRRDRARACLAVQTRSPARTHVSLEEKRLEMGRVRSCLRNALLSLPAQTHRDRGPATSDDSPAAGRDVTLPMTGVERQEAFLDHE